MSLFTICNYFQLGNHDQQRFASRYGSQRVPSLTTLAMTLPGVAVTYNGDEIGMEDFRDMSYQDTVDPQACNRGDPNDYKWSSRDPQRTPFQWDSSEYAGFSSAKPWLPVNPNYKKLNLEQQLNDETSTYHLYKNLMSLRKHETMIHGTARIHAINARILSVVRELEKQTTFITVISVGDLNEVVDLTEIGNISDKLKVVSASAKSYHKKG